MAGSGALDKLKDFYDARIVGRIADDVAAALPGFDRTAFVETCLQGFPPLALVDRARHVAMTLRGMLPDDYREAVRILLARLDLPLAQTEGNGMEPFRYLPHVLFVAMYGLDDFETSMTAQYELTQRFSAEFSIRLFLDRYPHETYARLEAWTADPSVHVRRLVSEGTRPRLPWAPRLRVFQQDPGPVVALLERLKDDPDLYVRRSVANNLNDIGKDHPGVVLEVCRRWWHDGGPDRRWIVRHALRSLVKAGNAEALALLGFGSVVSISVEEVALPSDPVPIGGRLGFACAVVNQSGAAIDLLVDYRVHFVKANGKTSPKVFKLRALRLAAGERVRVASAVSLAVMTTRKPYPGLHTLELLVNGATFPLGAVEVTTASP